MAREEREPDNEQHRRCEARLREEKVLKIQSRRLFYVKENSHGFDVI